MNKHDLNARTLPELISRYIAIGIEQDEAILKRNNKKYNQLFQEKIRITEELKARNGDLRTALLDLYDHPNMQVRLNAAKGTLAVAPTAAKELLRAIHQSGWQPQAGDAGMCLWTLEEGIFKPK
jgi:Domain of unknown function (DUF2019)